VALIVAFLFGWGFASLLFLGLKGRVTPPKPASEAFWSLGGGHLSVLAFCAPPGIRFPCPPPP